MAEATEIGGAAWYESALSGFGEVVGDALAIKTAGLLNGMKQDAGLVPKPADQLATRVDNTGANLTSGTTEAKLKTWMIYGGAVVLIVVILSSLMRR